MRLPFTAEQFFAVFRDYNDAVWPAQVVLVGLAAAAFFLIFVSRSWASIAISLTLAFFWAWLALTYHLLFFARINLLAYAFSGLSFIGAFIFLWQGVIRHRLRFAWRADARSSIGVALVVFALLVYPAWSLSAGHRYPAQPTFGLPCPTTIFTVGLLAFLVPPYPRSPFIVPVLWSAIGTQAAFLLDVPQDLSLIAAAVVGLVLLARSRAPVGLHEATG